VIREAIQKHVPTVDKLISERPDDSPVMFLGVLNGCYPFMVDFLRASRHAEGALISHVAVRDNKRVYNFDAEECVGYTIIVLDDICDRGDTLHHIVRYLEGVVGPDGEVLSVVLCDRPERHPQFTSTLAMLTVPETAGWLFGYGMDGYDGCDRYSPDIRHCVPRVEV
jgi:hypoxanthine-guanine phosphoribosyltransferase